MVGLLIIIDGPASTDPSGIDRCELKHSTDGGATYTDVTLSPEEQTSRIHTAMLTPGTNTQLFGALAVDRAGNGSS